MQNKLFVGSIPWKTREEDLVTLFSDYGTVVSARIITDKMSGKSRGFGFVEMSTEEEAQAALHALDGKEFMGRPLAISVAQPMRKDA